VTTIVPEGGVGLLGMTTIENLRRLSARRDAQTQQNGSAVEWQLRAAID
jgi:hypothetical protein